MQDIRERHGDVGMLVIDQSEKRNALSRALIGEIVAWLETFEKAKIRALINRAQPRCKVWSAGHDIS